MALAISAVLFEIGCASEDARHVERTAFLGDVSQLEPGKADEPSLLYISPTADFSAYEYILIDPVTVWYGSRSAPDPQTGAQLRALAERFESAIRTQLQASIFEVVDEPRPGTLRLRAAFTERGGGRTKLDLAGAYAVADTTGDLGAGTLAFLRGALQLEIVDAVTGKRLAAAIDDRLVADPGEEADDRLSGDTVSWREVETFLDTRAHRIAARLSALHELGGPESEAVPEDR